MPYTRDVRGSHILFVAALFAIFLEACNSFFPAASTLPAFREIGSPAPAGSLVPMVHGGQGNGIVLNWIEPVNDELASLRFSTWRNRSWSTPTSVIERRTLSRAGDEAAGVIALSENNFIAFWSEHVQGAQRDQNKNLSYVSGSSDGGAHWSTPRLLNLPGTREASNISAVAMDERRAAVVWLDGRDWDAQKHFLLAGAEANSDGALSKALILDPDTCTCCPTAMVTLATGDIFAAYRGHTKSEIRDMRFVRRTNSGWTEPSPIYADQWHFAGCPVNGPALDEVDGRIAAAWFTGVQDIPKVQLAFSEPGLRNFGSPLRVDSGHPLGRTQVISTPDKSVWVFWLENYEGTARFLARRFSLDGNSGSPVELARAQRFGYPRAGHDSKAALVAWEEVAPQRTIHVAELRF